MEIPNNIQILSMKNNYYYKKEKKSETMVDMIIVLGIIIFCLIVGIYLTK